MFKLRFKQQIKKYSSIFNWSLADNFKAFGKTFWAINQYNNKQGAKFLCITPGNAQKT